MKRKWAVAWLIGVLVMIGFLGSAAKAAEGNSGCGKNQTSAASYETLKNSKEMGKEAGTGLFLVPDPEKGPLEQRVVVVPNLTYHETVLRGEQTSGYKWISEKEMPGKDVVAKRGGPQAPRPSDCNGFCGPQRDWCRGLCICGLGNYCR